MIEKYVAVTDNTRKYKYYKGVPYISRKDFKDTKNYFLLGKTRLQKNKKKPHHKYLYYQNECFLIKNRIIGLKKGYINIGKNNYLVLKDYLGFVFWFLILLLCLSFCIFFFLSNSKIANQQKINKPKVKEILNNKKHHDLSINIQEEKIIQTNHKNYMAKQEITNYMINFDANGGYGVMENMQYYPEQSLILNKNCFKRLGYTFLGWSTKKNGKVIYKDQDIITSLPSTNQNLILYAIWGIDYYHILYHLDGGVAEDLIDTYHIHSHDIYIPNPIKEGYSFLGWINSKTKKTIKDSIIKKGSYGNLELSAEYIPNQYHVTFNTNGGEEKSEDKIVTFNNFYGELPTPTKKGYTFLGWKNASGEEVLQNTIYQNVYDTTLYASWKANTYTVTLNPKGGSLNTNSLTITYGDVYKNLPTPTKLGYSFVGWYYKGSLVEDDTILDRAFNHELYAEWKINTYTVTYLNANNTIYSTRNITYFDSIPNISYNTDSYHVFKGWYDYNGNSILNRKNLTNNLTVKASVREANCYLITGQAQDGDTSRIARFQELLAQKNLGGIWNYENGYYSYVSHTSNYTHIRTAANHLLNHAPSKNWPYLVWLGMFCDNGHSEQLR